MLEEYWAPPDRALDLWPIHGSSSINYPELFIRANGSAEALTGKAQARCDNAALPGTRPGDPLRMLATGFSVDAVQMPLKRL